jgi:NCAIR mutase (PurE)-related protein
VRFENKQTNKNLTKNLSFTLKNVLAYCNSGVVVVNLEVVGLGAGINLRALGH